MLRQCGSCYGNGHCHNEHHGLAEATNIFPILIDGKNPCPACGEEPGSPGKCSACGGRGEIDDGTVPDWFGGLHSGTQGKQTGNSTDASSNYNNESSSSSSGDPLPRQSNAGCLTVLAVFLVPLPFVAALIVYKKAQEDSPVLAGTPLLVLAVCIAIVFAIPPVWAFREAAKEREYYKHWEELNKR